MRLWDTVVFELTIVKIHPQEKKACIKQQKELGFTIVPPVIQARETDQHLPEDRLVFNCQD